jgi:hypothetical protein
MAKLTVPTYVKNGPCAVHKYHWPKPLRVVDHHIQPLEMGGEDVVVNKVRTCDTGHYNIHRSMGDYHYGTPQRGTMMERLLAQAGYDAWKADGAPGHFVYQLAEGLH